MPKVWGYDIPARDELSGAEVEALERIYSEKMTTARRAAEITSTLLRTRTKERAKPDELLEQPYSPGLEDTVTELVRPFLRIVEAREYRQALSQATSTSLEELRVLRARITETLAALDDIITEKEAGGSEPKAS